MVTKLAENLYTTQVPLPDNPLRYINVYFIKGDERTLVIDTGFNRPECENAIQAAFDELGVKDADIFVTHLHSDHCGLAARFASRNSTIYTGEIDGEYINFEVGDLYWRWLEILFDKHGFPRAKEGRNTDYHPGKQYSLDKRVDFTYVAEGDVLEYGGYKLKAIMTPGHTPGHMCLYDEENKRLFSGDHILGTITPNITIELGVENPLGDYLKSLDKIDQLEVDHLMTTHGTPVDDVHERIHELYKHHTARAAEVVKLLGDKSKHAYEVAADMTWEIDCRNWDEFPMAQKWFATGEAASHLQYLMYEGKLEREERDGVYYYRNK